MRYPGNIVMLDDTRSSGGKNNPEKCFYCAGKINEKHDDDCVVIHRPVRMRMTFDLIMEVPRGWAKEQIEFRYNEGTWCSGNITNDLERVFKVDECMCARTSFEYLGDATLEEAVEDGLEPDK